MTDEHGDTAKTGDDGPAEHTSPARGEDDSSIEKDGDDRYLHEDQKSPSLPS